MALASFLDDYSPDPPPAHQSPETTQATRERNNPPPLFAAKVSLGNRGEDMNSDIPSVPPARADDQSQLDALGIAHYVVGAVGVLFACMPLIHMGIGLSVILNKGPVAADMNTAPNMPLTPEMFGWLFFLLGAFFFLIGQTIAICLILAGRYLRRRTHYMFCFVVACVACIAFPIGTALGVFSLIVLNRPSVKVIFGE